MPLPFLTADRDLDLDTPAADSAALPHDEPDHWRRPYRPGPWRVGAAAVFLLLASFVLISAMIIAMAGSLPGAAACAVLGAVLIAFAVRLLRVGVWVSAHGLRQVNLLRTATEPWSAIAAVRTRQEPVRWLGLPRTVQGQSLIIERTQGEPLRPLITDHNGDFLSRPEAFERAADVLEAWAAEYRD
ncbi:phage holin family protein [Streptomyces sp. MCA2]|uniref:Phage holin family protein n=1 Tax=Streptomyces decoyicus TaxID=249567 RepID=A0ABZ1FEF2_9ACTN|nr:MULTISPECIES: phage holin family protein [Streptomyces]MCL7497083.1 phage holin family protein [Streptomyces sp. MCA2]WSB68645.1 phage holin family protein [Streptomyces decoyicus]